MSTKDKKIADTLAKFDEDFASSIWRVQGTAVIYHKALERIAAKASITWDEPTIIRAERDEAVIRVTGRMGDRMEWSIGEALIGVNYRVSGKQAAYVWAMAEKRAKDRVILKLIELSGDVYSEEEADEFKNNRPGSKQAANDTLPDQEDEGEDPRTSSQRIADEMILFISNRQSIERLEVFCKSDQAKADFGLLDPEDQARVNKATEQRRTQLLAA